MVILPSYRTLAQIHDGVNSQVYRAQHSDTRKTVILKLLKADYPTIAQLTRYRQEYKLTKKLNSERIIKTYGLEEYGRTLVMILEDFDAISLKEWHRNYRNKGLSIDQFLEVAQKITASLLDLHSHKVIHKDINPSNIGINPQDGCIKLLDLGIATEFSSEKLALINPNQIEGTLHYISPEQTGRMNREIDYRTDFYSLGITFYELLTGQLPFACFDPLEIVHCQIAKMPPPPHMICSQIPKSISQMVMKLIAKNAEERYQSSKGLQADLDCLKLNYCESKSTHTSVHDIRINTFELGKYDFSEEFNIPQKLYGRKGDINTLLNTFYQVVSHHQNSFSQSTSTDTLPNLATKLILISGYSGIGKSVLVKELYKPITEKRGYFISGKFSQIKNNIPYSAIVSAFTSLVHQILGESKDRLELWKQLISDSLGINAKIIIDVIPELELIIGPQSPAPILGDVESQNRFNLVFIRFIKLFCSVEHPLVICLDDLQWADSATLTLLDVILRDSSIHYLLLIGTYRSNEVSSNHPLYHLLNLLEKSNISIEKIQLSPLTLNHVIQLVSDTLHCDRTSSLPLAKLILKKTAGNPFFINFFLKKLHRERLITFDFKTQQWCWDMKQIEAQNITDNVVDLMISRLRDLPDNSQRLLSFAACLGAEFCLQELALVANRALYSVDQDLQRSIQWGLIVPLSDSDTDIDHKLYAFGHDRIQQASYALIPTSKKAQTHAIIGKVLLRHLSDKMRDEQIFLVVNQLNLGVKEIDSLSDQLELAQLNLLAGKRAKKSTAYDVAIDYFTIALDLIGDEAWVKHYSMALVLHQEISIAYYVRGKFEAMQIYINLILKRATSLLDKIPAYELQIQSYLARSYLDKSVQTAIYVARILGVNFSNKFNSFKNSFIQLRMKWMLRGLPPAHLTQLQMMRNPKVEAAIRILSSANSAAYVGQPLFLSPIISKQVELLIQHGNIPLSAFVYAWYGTFLCGRSLQINLGYQFGTLALKMLNQSDTENIYPKTKFIFYCMIFHWKNHVCGTLEPLLKAYHDGKEKGDVEYSSWAILVRCEHLFLMGDSLTSVEREFQRSEDAIRQVNQDSAFLHNQIYHQTVLNLIEKSSTPYHLFGNKFDESLVSTLQAQDKEQTGVFHAYLCQLMLSFWFGRHTEAAYYARMAKTYEDSAAGLFAIATFYLYSSLVQLQQYAKANHTDKRYLLKTVTANQKKMKRWAKHAPDNHWHKFLLVEAERHNVQGHRLKAMDYYDRAIAAAKQQGYINEEALANELAAQFYLEWGREKIAQGYMRDAHYCYTQWGAIAKVKDLEERYASLLSQTLMKGGMTVTQTLTAGSLIRTRSGLALDLASVQKAYQALSREIILEHLLKTLMGLILENAGAQRGVLILPQGDDLLIQASSQVDTAKTTVLQAIPVSESSDVSAHIINYVARTHTPMVLDNACHDPLVAHDPYVQQHRPYAVLCMPLLNQGQLQGIIYLENNLIVGAFTRDRVKVLELLSGQAAIAITNAKLYAQISHSEKQLKQFLEAIPVGIGVLDAQGHPYYVNQRAQTLLHQGILPDISANDITQRYHVYRAGTNQVYPSDELPIIKALRGDVSSVDDLEIHVNEANGHPGKAQSASRICLESWGTPIYDEAGKLKYALTAFQDITQRKQAEILLADYSSTLESQVAKRTEELQQANRELERLASLDGLTHIANRRSFDTYLFESWRRQIEEPQALSLILADIDYFKRYNDHYGHQAGDDCLVLVAQKMAQVAKRSMDLVARYGGEEFAIILPGTDLEGAAQVAERIRVAIMGLNLSHAMSEVSDQVTLSLGVASIVPTLEQLLDDLIANADKALYQAKEEGRNRVVKC